MLILGLEHFHALRDGRIHSAKMIFNANGAIFFPASRQHRDLKAEGISYEDNYKGNAMAAMLSRGTLEIRFHQEFKEAEVARLVDILAMQPGVEALLHWGASYQGRPIKEELASEWRGMTTNERLYASGQLSAWDDAARLGDRDRMIACLRAARFGQTQAEFIVDTTLKNPRTYGF